ncbi:metallophosphoesterase [Candidatus Pacearchaeota archaeon]|nr:metallophosphoesterase [Candidatus Pacearchaeota archaeon]
MKNDILKICMEKGILLDKEGFELINNLGDREIIIDFLDKLNKGFRERFITKSFIVRNINKIQEFYYDSEKKKVIEKLLFQLGIDISVEREISEKSAEPTESAEIVNARFKIVDFPFLPSQKLEVDHFIRYFRNRFEDMKRIIQERAEMEGVISINRLVPRKQASFIGMVINKRYTKNKNLLIEFEDPTARINVLINKNMQAYAKAKELLFDDIVGVKGSGDGELFFANDIIYPDVFIHEKAFLDREEYALFTSDVHVGSTMFLSSNFERFIRWINSEVGDEKQKATARKVRYLFIVGDTIDGVGVYPGQERLLGIKDIREQYKELARYLGMIREDITIFMIPGQHDSVRVAEPQPPIGADYAEPIHQLKNVVLLGNPAMIEITNNGKKGIKILMYHGASMNSFISEIEELRMIKAHHYPAKVVKYLLKRRHLAPIHSSVLYIPSERDLLMIREIPDVIVTGDLHRSTTDYYNGVQIITSSCWQSMTPFEEKVGNTPDPCKVPLMNLKTREVKMLDFS